MQSNRDANIVPPLLLSHGVKLQHSVEADTIVWTNKDVPKSIISLLVLPIFWLASAAVVGRIAYALLTGEVAGLPLLNKLFVWFFFLGFGWLVLRTPTAIKLGILDTETITISNNEILINRTDYNKHFARKEVLGLWFGKYRTEDGGRSVEPTLYLAYRDRILGISGQRTEQLAFWMRVREKKELFLLMKRVFKARDWNIEYKNNV